MALVWMLTGPQAGQFVPVSEAEQRRLVEAGEAQPATTPPHLMRDPRQYVHREMTAEPVAEVPDAPSPSPAKRRRRKGHRETA